jgi:hypothetical protein
MKTPSEEAGSEDEWERDSLAWNLPRVKSPSVIREQSPAATSEEKAEGDDRENQPRQGHDRRPAVSTSET